MSYSSAVDAVKTTLSGDPIGASFPSVALHYSPDPRLESLTDLDGFVDAAFLLVNESAGNPFPYVQGINPTEAFANMRLEVCTLLQTDILLQDKTAEERGRAVINLLTFETYSDFVVFNPALPTRKRVAQDRRVVWEWKFSMRYTQ